MLRLPLLLLLLLLRRSNLGLGRLQRLYTTLLTPHACSGRGQRTLTPSAPLLLLPQWQGHH